MAKKYKKKAAPRIRRKTPLIETVEGGIEIRCPFCHPSHVLRVDMPSPCGTVLEFKAVQNLYQDVTCALCGGKQGTLMKIGDRYRHSYDCKPGHHLFAQTPPLSLAAKLCWRLPNFAHMFIFKRFKRRVMEVSDKETKELIGYAWRKF